MDQIRREDNTEENTLANLASILKIHPHPNILVIYITTSTFKKLKQVDDIENADSTCNDPNLLLSATLSSVTRISFSINYLFLIVLK